MSQSLRAVFMVDGLHAGVLALQPWLTFVEVARYLSRHDWQVHFVSNRECDAGALPDGVSYHRVGSLRPSARTEIRGLLASLAPAVTVCPVTPMSLAATGWYRDVPGRLYAFASYPCYSASELGRALGKVPAKELSQYLRHLLVPSWWWRRRLRDRFDGVIGQSTRTLDRVTDLQRCCRAHMIPAGLQSEHWSPGECEPPGDADGFRLLYVGSPKSIRGFDVMLDALSQLGKATYGLRILARGSTSDEIEALSRRVRERLGEGARQVEFVGGWMDRDAYRDEIRAADLVLLPFVLVPSELPVSVIECIACGTPVVTTDIDGLPQAAGEAGRIVRTGDAAALAAALSGLLLQPGELDALKRACAERRAQLLDWEQVGARWLELFVS